MFPDMKRKIVVSCTFIAAVALEAKLINIKTVIPDIILDVRYATENNFIKQKIYSSASCYLLEPVAHALRQVQDELKSRGYRLKMFDAYRPMRAQRLMWSAFPDPRYVSDPAIEYGRHTRGTSVDVTLCTADGVEVEMPTDFDEFSEKAHSDYQFLPSKIIANRKLLCATMKKYGFNGIKCEWWHFDFDGWQTHPTLDISFEELEAK